MNHESSMNQAPMTVAIWLRQAIENIDAVFDKGYAQAHPELLASFIQSCAIDYQTSRLEEVGKSIASAIVSSSE